MPRASKPLSPKDTIVLETLLQYKSGSLIDADQLASEYYRRLRAKRPTHWRQTLMNTLQRLKDRGAPIKRVGGGKGTGNTTKWERL